MGDETLSTRSIPTVVVKLLTSRCARCGTSPRRPEMGDRLQVPPEEKRRCARSSRRRAHRRLPTAIFDPCIWRVPWCAANLHNQDEIDAMDLTCWTMSGSQGGEIIPEVVRVEHDRRPGILPFKIPDECPVCGSRAVRLPGGRPSITNSACPARIEGAHNILRLAFGDGYFGVGR
ncbi:MAG: hypothetical protein ACLUEQ_04470 [Cloacibacillus evryensis]